MMASAAFRANNRSVPNPGRNIDDRLEGRQGLGVADLAQGGQDCKPQPHVGDKLRPRPRGHRLDRMFGLFGVLAGRRSVAKAGVSWNKTWRKSRPPGGAEVAERRGRHNTVEARQQHLRMHRSMLHGVHEDLVSPPGCFAHQPQSEGIAGAGFDERPPLGQEFFVFRPLAGIGRAVAEQLDEDRDGGLKLRPTAGDGSLRANARVRIVQQVEQCGLQRRRPTPGDVWRSFPGSRPWPGAARLWIPAQFAGQFDETSGRVDGQADGGQTRRHLLRRAVQDGLQRGQEGLASSPTGAHGLARP